MALQDGTRLDPVKTKPATTTDIARDVTNLFWGIVEVAGRAKKAVDAAGKRIAENKSGAMNRVQ